MLRVVSILLTSIATWFRSRWSLQMELIALRHQVAVYQQSLARPKLQPADRLLWVWLSRVWPGWQEALEFVQPQTVIAWQKKQGANGKSWLQPGLWGQYRRNSITQRRSWPNRMSQNLT